MLTHSILLQYEYLVRKVSALYAQTEAFDSSTAAGGVAGVYRGFVFFFLPWGSFVFFLRRTFNKWLSSLFVEYTCIPGIVLIFDSRSTPKKTHRLPTVLQCVAAVYRCVLGLYNTRDILIESCDLSCYEYAYRTRL